MVVATALVAGCGVTPTTSPAVPAPSATPSAAAVPSPSPSPSPPVASSTARGLPASGGLHIVAVENPGCASEGECAAFFRIQPTPGISTPLAPEWRFEGESAALHAPVSAPTTLLPGAYRVSAHLNWVSDVISPGTSPAIGGGVSSCDGPLTIDQSVVDVIVRVTFHGNDPCAIEVVTNPPT